MEKKKNMKLSHVVELDNLNPAIKKKIELQEEAIKKGQSLGKTWEEWEALEAAERKTFKGKVKYAWEDYIYYPLYRLVQKPGEYKEYLIAFYQRGRRGYADSDCWGLDDYLSSWLPAALRHMVDKEQGGGNGYPGVGKANTFEKWKKIVEKIARGFEASYELSDGMYDQTKGKGKKLYKEQEEGLKLFIEWYQSLWD